MCHDKTFIFNKGSVTFCSHGILSVDRLKSVCLQVNQLKVDPRSWFSSWGIVMFLFPFQKPILSEGCWKTFSAVTNIPRSALRLPAIISALNVHRCHLFLCLDSIGKWCSFWKFSFLVKSILSLKLNYNNIALGNFLIQDLLESLGSPSPPSMLVEKSSNRNFVFLK